MIRAVIFDFFGVLHTDTLWGLANRYIPNRTQEQAEQLSDLARAANLGRIQRADFWQAAADIYQQDLSAVLAARAQMGVIDQSLLAVCDQLKNKGVVVAIVSNVGAGYLRDLLSEEQATEYFDVVIESGAVGLVKPQPEIFEYACEKIGVAAKECIFFDDSERNVAAANALGMQGVHYTGLQSCTAALQSAGLIADL